MLRRAVFVCLLSSFSLAAIACTSAGEDASETGSANLSGPTDDAYRAVVALTREDAFGSFDGHYCAGTIVKTDPARKLGWVLTSAKCLGAAPDTARMGNKRYRVLDGKPDPAFDPHAPAGGHDFAVLRVTGVDASTPKLEVGTADDGLALLMTVRSVGFDTTPDVPSWVELPIFGLSADFITYSQTDKGFCDADIGGPVLAGSRIVGVHSYLEHVGTGACSGKAHSGRLGPSLAFVEHELGAAPALDTCKACELTAESSGGECKALADACTKNEACAKFAKCMGAGGTQATCAHDAPLGEGPWLAATTCACNRSCADKCAAEPKCASVPKCGITPKTATTCSSCMESDDATCAAERDCVADGTCYACLKSGDADPRCGSNAARKKVGVTTASACGQICVMNGHDGRDGHDGDAGTNGANGQDGSNGTNGKDGAVGAVGAVGAPGLEGVDGVPGASGNDGANGKDGAAGKAGAKGADACAMTPGPHAPSMSLLLLGVAVVLARLRRR